MIPVAAADTITAATDLAASSGHTDRSATSGTWNSVGNGPQMKPIDSGWGSRPATTASAPWTRDTASDGITPERTVANHPRTASDTVTTDPVSRPSQRSRCVAPEARRRSSATRTRTRWSASSTAGCASSTTTTSSTDHRGIGTPAAAARTRAAATVCPAATSARSSASTSSPNRSPRRASCAARTSAPERSTSASGGPDGRSGPAGPTAVGAASSRSSIDTSLNPRTGRGRRSGPDDRRGHAPRRAWSATRIARPAGGR